MEDPVKVFIAFDRENINSLLSLKAQLDPLVKAGFITIWDATQLLGRNEPKIIYR